MWRSKLARRAAPSIGRLRATQRLRDRIAPSGARPRPRPGRAWPDGGSWRVERDVKPFVFDRAGLVLHWDSATHSVVVEQAMVGAGEGNVIAANGQDGIYLTGSGSLDGSGTQVKGNLIGVGADGVGLLDDSGFLTSAFSTGKSN